MDTKGFRRAFMGSAIAVGAAVVITGRIHAAPPACDPDNGGIKLPQGFCALVAADNLAPIGKIAEAFPGELNFGRKSVMHSDERPRAS